MASKHLPRRAKTKGGLEKCLANPGSRQKITKTTHAVRGLQTKWEIQVYKSPTVSAGGLNGLLPQPDGNFAFQGKVMVWSAGPNKTIDPGDPANDHENHDNVLSWQ
jgi:hypothetical protein